LTDKSISILSKVRPKSAQPEKKDGDIDPKFWELLLSADKKDYEQICAEFGVTDFRWMLKKLKEIKKEREEEKHVADSDCCQSDNAQMIQEGPTEEATVTESKTLTQAENSEAPNLHKVSSSKLAPQESEKASVAAESVVQPEQAQQSAPDSSTEEKDLNKSVFPEEGPEESSMPEDDQERNAAVNKWITLFIMGL